MVARAGLPLEVSLLLTSSGCAIFPSTFGTLYRGKSAVVFLQDLEFVQFHPTGIYGAGCLITEGLFLVRCY